MTFCCGVDEKGIWIVCNNCYSHVMLQFDFSYQFRNASKHFGTSLCRKNGEKLDEESRRDKEEENLKWVAEDPTKRIIMRSEPILSSDPENISCDAASENSSRNSSIDDDASVNPSNDNEVCMFVLFFACIIC